MLFSSQSSIFHKTLNQTTTNDLELRTCLRYRANYDNIAVELVELYIQLNEEKTHTYLALTYTNILLYDEKNNSYYYWFCYLIIEAIFYTVSFNHFLRSI